MSKSITGNWNDRCLKTIRQDRLEVERRYNIRFGLTEIYCRSCGKPINDPGGHTCQAIRLEQLHETSKIELKPTPEHCDRVKAIGMKKTARKLGVGYHAVSSWIRKGSIPLKHRNAVMGL